jgi:hypothetical protein
MRTMETPKADAAGSGTRDWFSIMQRFASSLDPAGLLHYYMPATEACCTTKEEKTCERGYGSVRIDHEPE